MTIRKVENYELAPCFKHWFDLDTVDREHTHQMVGPGLIRVDLRIAPHGRLGTDAQRGYIVANCNTPIDENNLESRWIMMTKWGERFPADPTMTLVQGIAAEFPAVALEDVWALEKQHEALEFSPEFADGSLYCEVNLRADKGVMTARLALSKMEQAEGSRLFGIAVPDRGKKATAA
jgi:vanillate O-demethylase monooxygenase subunit